MSSEAIKTVQLGDCGLKLCRIGCGTGTVAGGKESNQTRLGDDPFNDLLTYAYDRGIRFFDTADDYGTHRHVARALQDVPEGPRSILDHSYLSVDKGLSSARVAHVQVACHDVLVPDSRPNPLEGSQRLRLAHANNGRIIWIDEVASPAVHVNLDAIPGYVEHAAPLVDLSIGIAIAGEETHRLRIVVVVPALVRIADLVLVKEVSVEVEGESTMVLG